MLSHTCKLSDVTDRNKLMRVHGTPTVGPVTATDLD